MYDEINNNRIYWRNMYIRDCRRGRSYKYDNWNYKLKYLQKIYKYYSTILKDSKHKLEYTTNMLSAEVNNAEIYLQILREAVLTNAIDLPNQIYHIPDLKQALTASGHVRRLSLYLPSQVHYPIRNVVHTMYRDIRFDEILNSRRICLKRIVLCNKTIAEDTPKIQKIENIIEGLNIVKYYTG